MCDVNGINLDKEEIKFKYLAFEDMHHIAINGTDETGEQYSVHNVVNASHDVHLGHGRYGLLHSTPPDVLHVIRKGVVE